MSKFKLVSYTGSIYGHILYFAWDWPSFLLGMGTWEVNGYIIPLPTAQGGADILSYDKGTDLWYKGVGLFGI